MPNITSDICPLCDLNEVGDLPHSLVVCPYNDGAGQYLLDVLQPHCPDLVPQQVVLLDLQPEENLRLPVVFLIASVLSQIWLNRSQKKPCHLVSIRANLEAGVNIMRKSRHKEAATKLSNLLNIQ